MTGPSADAPRIAFYGDDFTGSTDALEVLAKAGLRTMLFTGVPSTDVLARYPGLDAVGIAGNSRSLTPDEMDSAVPPAMRALRATGAPLLHYKVCSTIDSAPDIGSIGRVMDLWRADAGPGTIPIVVGAPRLGRYSAFGTLFARHNVDGTVHRIDRHPTMSIHPSTPMREGDMRRHIGAQTAQTIALLPGPEVARGSEAALERALALAPDALVMDLFTDDDEPRVGALLERMAAGSAGRARAPLFVVGSSGVEYALAARWAADGRLPAEPRWDGQPVDRIFAVSGSCSPVTGAQIAAALRDGFAQVALDPVALLREGPGGAHAETAVAQALRLLAEGRSVMAHSSTGPDDPREGQVAEHFARAGLSREAGRLRGGRALAKAAACMLGAVLERAELRRFVVAGGDTSSAAVEALGIDALEMLAPLTPGAPLCRILAPGRRLNGCETVLKGGQMGGPDFFAQARAGRV